MSDQRRGRPPKDEIDRKTCIVQIPLTNKQKEQMFLAAQSSGKDFAVWARDILLDALQPVGDK